MMRGGVSDRGAITRANGRLRRAPGRVVWSTLPVARSQSLRQFVHAHKPIVHLTLVDTTKHGVAVLAALARVGGSLATPPRSWSSRAYPRLHTLDTPTRRYSVFAPSAGAIEALAHPASALVYADAVVLCLRPDDPFTITRTILHELRARGGSRLIVLTMDGARANEDVLADFELVARETLYACGFDGDAVRFIRWRGDPTLDDDEADRVAARLLAILTRRVPARVWELDAPFLLRLNVVSRSSRGRLLTGLVVRGRAPIGAALDLVIWGEEDAEPVVLEARRFRIARRDAFGHESVVELSAGQLAAVDLRLPRKLHTHPPVNALWWLVAPNTLEVALALRVRVRGLPRAALYRELSGTLYLRFAGEDFAGVREDRRYAAWELPDDEWIEFRVELQRPVVVALADRFTVHVLEARRYHPARVLVGHGEVLETLEHRVLDGDS